MRRFNVVVSDEAGESLDDFKKAGGFTSLDTALDCFLMLHKKEESPLARA